MWVLPIHYQVAVQEPQELLVATPPSSTYPCVSWVQEMLCHGMVVHRHLIQILPVQSANHLKFRRTSSCTIVGDGGLFVRLRLGEHNYLVLS